MYEEEYRGSIFLSYRKCLVNLKRESVFSTGQNLSVSNTKFLLKISKNLYNIFCASETNKLIKV